MPEKSTFDYIDNDPLVPVTLINPVSNKKAKAIAYFEHGTLGSMWNSLKMNTRKSLLSIRMKEMF